MLKLKKFRLLNDFEASAFGLKSLTKDDLIVINHGKENKLGT